MSEFKVGDKVRVTRTGLHNPALVGQEGTITATEAGGIWPYEVMFEGGETEVFNTKEIELVEPEDASTIRGGFKPGDRVRIVRSGYRQHAGRLPGGTGTVEAWLPYDEGTVHLTLDSAESENAEHWPFSVEDLEHLEEDEPDYGTSGETNLTYQAAETTDEPNYRIEALFGAIQSFSGTGLATTSTDIVHRAERFLKFLEGKND